MLKEQMEDALKVSFTNLSIITIMMIMIIIMIMIKTTTTTTVVIVMILVYGPLYSVAFTFETVPCHKNLDCLAIAMNLEQGC